MIIPFNILDFLKRASLVFKDRVAVFDPSASDNDPLKRLTYEELWHAVCAQARALDKMGLGPGNKVAVLSDNNIRFFTSLFSVSGFGRILVPLNYRLSKHEIEYILSHCKADLLLVDEKSFSHAQGLPIRTIVLEPKNDHILFDTSGPPQPWLDADENAAASINYTSGTTALPKGVVLTHRNLYIAALTVALHLGIREHETYLHTLPLFHCNGWGMPYSMSVMGATHIIHQKCTGPEIFNAVDLFGVTQLNGAPMVMARLVEEAKHRNRAPKAGRHQLRTLVAGAMSPKSLIADIEVRLNAEYIQLYGLTETAPLLTICKSRSEWNLLSVEERAHNLHQQGPAAMGIELVIGTDGEILARGNGVMKEYYDDVAASQNALRDNWFHTGDMGVISREHYLQVVDRKKDMIISGGENVASLEVENVLCLHPSIKEAGVIGMPHNTWGEMVTAFIVLHDGKAAREEDIIEHCRRYLAGFKCPKKIEFVESLERSATGKLQKYKLRERFAS